ncbi:hypothetical protein [Actinomycetospora cinnamomea]|uniref:Uncharacterized protein n=1 Tax=Actinomycetospora cinnamomea TaxID=663609 RepID=A0A2U1F9U0_9PSEU|nr:hypothetical protein [Actinomycetospora cinnamomea]PVZ08957.1 hypothetical protein C8D89_107119 [Actinomycetospora cinnamomea]
MLIDCDTCAVRDVACHDCVVGVLLGTPTVPAASAAGPSDAAPGGPLPLDFGPVEQRALEVLADHGLIPRLRLVLPAPAAPPPARDGRAAPRRARDVG